MEYDLSEVAPREAYRLVTHLVTPRPIAWVTSVSPSEIVNAAPFSYFNLLGSEPTLVGIGVNKRRTGELKDTAANALALGEFVVNIVDADNAPAMNLTAVELPYGESEIEYADLEVTPSSRVTVPRIASAPAALECRLHQHLSIGRNDILIGEVVHIFVRDGYDWQGMHAIGRGGGNGYFRPTDRFEMERPSPPYR